MLTHPPSYSAIIRGRYCPHIDGLRAVAVLSVLLYHAFPKLCPGGFMGVDVFFAISGYLITKGLVHDLENDEYTIGRFYVRRIRRILPAYSAMIAFAVVLGIVCYYGRSLLELARTAVSSTAFAANIYFAIKHDYFAPNSHENPLLNLWSLSVEEQFYIFFPLILAGLHRWAKPWLKSAIWGMAVISLVTSTGCVFLWGKGTSAFYGLPFRAWELLGGSLLAIYGVRNSRSVGVTGFAALIVLIFCLFVINDSMPFPGATAIIPVVCAVVLINGGGASMAKHILEHPVAVSIGRISYSLYLLHWPLLVYSRYAFHGYLSDVTIPCIAVVACFILSALSWKYIEMPFRRTRWEAKRYFVTALAILALCGGLSLFSMALYQYEQTHPVCKVEHYWDGVPPSSHRYPEPSWEDSDNREPNTFTVLGKDENPEYVLWGDSHAMALAPGWHGFSKRTGINGLYINRKHTLMCDTYSASYPHNAEWIDTVLSWLEKHPEIKHVVLVNRWAVRATGFTNEDGKAAKYYRRDHKDGSSQEIFAEGLVELCQKLVAMQKNIVILSSVPEQGADVPKLLTRFGLIGAKPSAGISYAEYTERQKEAREVLQKIQNDKLAHVIWLDNVFYPNGQAIPLSRGGTSLYVDDDHMSPEGARYLLEQISEDVIRAFGKESKKAANSYEIHGAYRLRHP